MKAAPLIVFGVASVAAAVAGCANRPPGSSAARAAARAARRPIPTHRVAPRYPAFAQYKGVQGDVKVCFTVDADGSAHGFHVADARFWADGRKPPDRDAEGQLEHEALTTVEQWRFKPRRADGRPVKTPDTCQLIRFREKTG